MVFSGYLHWCKICNKKYMTQFAKYKKKLKEEKEYNDYDRFLKLVEKSDE